MQGYRRALAEAARAPAPDHDPFAGAATLDRAALIEAVLARNPDVEAARAGWRRALSRVPQEAALDDPTVSYAVAPLSIAGDAPLGQRIELEQKLPLTGRRDLAGDAALAEADAMREDVAAVRLRLAALASSLYDDYYVAARSLDVDAHHRALLAQMRASAEAQYTAGRASAQDPLQVELELAMAERERLMHETEQRVVVARINGLLHRDLDAALPPAPAQLPVLPASQEDLAARTAAALRERPELRGQDAKVRNRDAAQRLADRLAWPDLAVMASYDSMWDLPEHRWMLGVSIDVPLSRGRRAAARDEAEAQADEARLLRTRLADDVRVEVRVAVERLAEARAALTLYEDRMRPAARLQAEAARQGFVTGQNDLQVALAAERGLRHVSLETEKARAEVHRRRAELDRATGRSPAGAR